MTTPQIFLKVASNENDGAIVRGSKGLPRSQSLNKAPFHLPPLRINHQIEDDSTDESGEFFSLTKRVKNKKCQKQKCPLFWEGCMSVVEAAVNNRGLCRS